jgi:hypothetical protein
LKSYTGASFVLDSSSPRIYSGRVQSNGYYSAPSDVYFNGDFTITALVNVISQQDWSRILDFGNGAANNNVFISFSYYATGQPIIQVFNNGNLGGMDNPSSTTLQFSKWTHIAGILKGNNISIYLNCTLRNSEILTYLPRNLVRNNNYIGKSNWPDDYANAKFRNVRIYNRALSQNELKTDFNDQ